MRNELCYNWPAMRKLIAGARKLNLELSPKEIEQFNIYYLELMDWNKRMNLTAVTGYEEVQVKHFLDALTVTLAWPQPLTNNSPGVIDVGTGAGIPGIPLKIVLPRIKLTLLDSITKKAGFLRHVVNKLGLDNVEIVIGRAEEMAQREDFREKFDIVLSRAVAQLATLVELTLPFCATGGIFIAQKKGNIGMELAKSERAIGSLGGKLREVKEVNLTELDDERRLIVIEKISPTPPKYPRRAGIPAKRPLL